MCVAGTAATLIVASIAILTITVKFVVTCCYTTLVVVIESFLTPYYIRCVLLMLLFTKVCIKHMLLYASNIGGVSGTINNRHKQRSATNVYVISPPRVFLLAC